MDTTDYLVKKMQRQLGAYKEEIVKYKRLATDAQSVNASLAYVADMQYFSGKYDALYEAIAMIQDAE